MLALYILPIDSHLKSVYINFYTTLSLFYRDKATLLKSPVPVERMVGKDECENIVL